MSDPNQKYSQEDSKNDTQATDKEQYSAWHQARDDFVSSYGDGSRTSLDPGSNQDGYREAFGNVGEPLK